MHRRRLKLLLLVLLTPVVLLGMFLVFERVRGQISLALYKRELIAKGEKLTFQELIPPPSEGEDGAPKVFEAARRLQPGNVLPDDPPRYMSITPSGRAVLGLREDTWVWGKKTNNWTSVVMDLETNASTLDEIVTALNAPVFKSQLDYSMGFKMWNSNLATAKQLTFWLGPQSQLALREGRNGDALQSLVAEIRLPRLLAEDRIVISELVRIAIAAIVRTTTWEALQSKDWSDENLAQLQEIWQSHNFTMPMRQSLEGDRAFGETAYEPMRKSNEEAVQLLFWMEDYSQIENSDRPFWERTVRIFPYGDVMADFLRKQVYCRLWRFAWSHQDEQRYLEGMQHLIEIARAAEVKRSYVDTLQAMDHFSEKYYNNTFYDNLRYPGPVSTLTLSKVLNRAMKADTECSTIICAIALKRYSIRHGKLPATLDALMPEFLESVPIDYMDGKPMKYHVNVDGSFTLYSVGENGVDDGGDVSLLPDKTGFHNLWNRNDFVWPSPASPEEVEAWRTEAAGK